VPTTVRRGGAARVHLEFRPNVEKKAHWNNEVADLTVWVAPPAPWQIDKRSLSTPRPPQPVSQEMRRVEFEVRVPEDAKPGPRTLPAYALYYVCEDVRGACLYRRQDLDIPLQVGHGPTSVKPCFGCGRPLLLLQLHAEAEGDPVDEVEVGRHGVRRRRFPGRCRRGRRARAGTARASMPLEIRRGESMANRKAPPTISGPSPLRQPPHPAPSRVSALRTSSQSPMALAAPPRAGVAASRSREHASPGGLGCPQRPIERSSVHDADLRLGPGQPDSSERLLVQRRNNHGDLRRPAHSPRACRRQNARAVSSLTASLSRSS
jgi:hypothetical protein